MTDHHREWLRQQAEAARQQVPGAPLPEVGPVDPETNTYPVHLPARGDEEPRRLLTLIPDTWVEGRQMRRIIGALTDALRHHLG